MDGQSVSCTQHIAALQAACQRLLRGLVAILLAVYSGKSADEIIATDGLEILQSIGLQDHLTPQRSNGLASMVKRIQGEALSAKAA